MQKVLRDKSKVSKIGIAVPIEIFTPVFGVLKNGTHRDEFSKVHHTIIVKIRVKDIAEAIGVGVTLVSIDYERAVVANAINAITERY